MTTLSDAPELIGELIPSEYFRQNFAPYESEFLEQICEKGYPRELWPSGEFFLPGLVHRSICSKSLPQTVPTSQNMVHDAYTGPKQHELVTVSFRHSFKMHEKAFFVITENEDWWPHEKSFLVHNADSAMLYFLYTRARNNKDVILQPKKRGRPRDEAAHAIKNERSERYNQWLAECEIYREKYNELKAAYLKSYKEYLDYKETGAPKWIP